MRSGGTPSASNLWTRATRTDDFPDPGPAATKISGTVQLTTSSWEGEKVIEKLDLSHTVVIADGTVRKFIPWQPDHECDLARFFKEKFI